MLPDNRLSGHLRYIHRPSDRGAEPMADNEQHRAKLQEFNRNYI
jgi:hypothetical protein